MRQFEMHPYYTNIHKDGFYKLALSSNFSEYSTIERFSFLGNKRNLTTVKEGDIIFSARGVQFGRVIMFPEKVENVITNIDSLVIQSNQSSLVRSVFITMFLNFLRRNKHIYKIAITGSGANSLTQYQSNDINFPNFDEAKQKEISLLYHSERMTYDYKSCSLDDFLQWDTKYNDEAGIYELDKTMKQLKEKLSQAIDYIVNDRQVDLNFS